MPSKVFISYRREDSKYQARRVYDAFEHALPPDAVFMDVDTIPPGADFVEILEGWVQQCDVLLALIGPNWLGSIDPRTNLRRLDNPEDFVRIEVRGALERKIPVVPVLLDATEMPTAAELPDDIKALRRRHAEFVDFRTFDADVQRLIKRLKIGKKIELPGVAGPQAGGNVVRRTLAAANTFFQRIKPDAVAAKPLLLAAAMASLLLVVGAAAYAITAWTHVDASAGLADFARSEEGRRSAEARAKEATDGLAAAGKARQEAEATAAAATAAQAKSEEGQRTAETRAGEASDAQTKAEKARQEAEAKATAAVTALVKAEENWRATEATANYGSEALKKSEKARLDAEGRATSAAAAQAKAEEAQRTAEKARAAAETVANAAASAKAQADNSRQVADKRANEAAEALRKSEKAREEAEAKVEELRKIADARPSPAPSQPSPSSASRKLLTDIGSKSQWVFGGTTSCYGKNVTFLSLEVGSGSITWINGLGNRTVERVLASDENTFRTEGSGLTWAYSRNGDNIDAQASIGRPFVLKRCP